MMRGLVALSVGLLFAGLVGVGLSLTCWGVECEVQGMSVLGRVQLRAEACELRVQEARRRIEKRTAVLTALADGQLTLLEAAAWFRALDAAIPVELQPYLRVFPGNSDEERLCRKVINYTNWLFDEYDHTRLQALRARLEAELLQALDSSETILLPHIEPE
jgi:hypothetical protein